MVCAAVYPVSGKLPLNVPVWPKFAPQVMPFLITVLLKLVTLNVPGAPTAVVNTLAAVLLP